LKYLAINVFPMIRMGDIPERFGPLLQVFSE
jgi:hypothetical protein